MGSIHGDDNLEWLYEISIPLRGDGKMKTKTKKLTREENFNSTKG